MNPVRSYNGGNIICLGFNKYSVYLKVVFMKETCFGSLNENEYQMSFEV